MNDFKLFGGSSHPVLAQNVANHLGVSLGRTLATQFADGETRVEILESARGNDVCIIQPTCAPANDTLMELCILLDGFKRASVKNITAVIPYMGYARQDKKVHPREPITAKMVADFLQMAGATHVMVIDLHSDQTQGFFNIPVDNLMAGPIVGKYFRDAGMFGPEYCVVSPDEGGIKRASYLANYLDCGVAFTPKSRPAPNVVKMGDPVGDVKGKKIIWYDDMWDTCGTIKKSVEKVMAFGAKEGYVACTHAVLSGNGAENLESMKGFINHCVCVDTIPLKPQIKDYLGDYLIQLPCAPLIGDAIKCHQNGGSVSSLFDEWRVN